MRVLDKKAVKKSEIQRIFEQEGSTRRFSKGDMLYHQGDSAESFYYLKKGRARVFMTSPDGAEKTLSTASGGEILGEAAFFDKMPRISSACATADAEVVIVDESRLIALIQKSPKLALELLKIQATRIRQLSAQIDAITFMQADGRISRLLMQNAREENGRKTVSLTHEEIAAIVGVNRVTVSKILNRFKKSGSIQTEYRKIVILDEAKLIENRADL